MSERIKITVIEEADRDAAESVLFHDTEKTLLHTLREGGIMPPSLCGSIGKCGRCQVRFWEQAPLPSQTDRAMIAPDKLREGYRLACMARPKKACRVEIAFEKEKGIDVVVKSSVKGERLDRGGVENGGREWQNAGNNGRGNVCEKCYDGKAAAGVGTAVAVDIGTTTIAMQLIETESGQVLDTHTCLNPQRSYGADVISRIQAGAEGEGERLKRMVREALAHGIGQMVKRSAKPKLMIISANTVMEHLFMGYPVESLGKSPFLPVNIKTVTMDYLGIPTVLLPGISAFVGGDIVSGLYACGLCPSAEKESGIWLFLDLGTNAEMVIGKGNRLICTAAAAGPAFEGKGKRGGRGSERIEATASVLEKGIVDKAGLLKEPYFENGIEAELENKKEKIWICQEDIRDIQMAKAAVRAGIYFLMERMGIRDVDEIGRVYVAGGFGFYLKRKAAVEIGLLPAKLEEKIEVVGNTSLAGAKSLLADIGSMDTGYILSRGEAVGMTDLTGREKIPGMEAVFELEKAVRNAEVFQLAKEPFFQEKYIEYMNF